MESKDCGEAHREWSGREERWKEGWLSIEI
jgi:hypothetical protein